MDKNSNKVKVSRHALEGRVKRALERDSQALRKCREDSRWFGDLGNYYVVDLDTNFIKGRHYELEQFARELQALKPFEVLAD